MVTANNLTTTYNGLSTDQKPLNGRNGDKFIEINTGKTYLYDEAGSQWTEVSSGSGGGGGSSDFTTATVTVAAEPGASFYLYMPFTFDSEERTGLLSSGITESGTYTTPLYKGLLGCPITIGSDYSIQTSGDIQNVGEFFLITGDGTITISLAQ